MAHAVVESFALLASAECAATVEDRSDQGKDDETNFVECTHVEQIPLEEAVATEIAGDLSEADELAQEAGRLGSLGSW